MTTLPTYVLITPARNEANFIELTLKSVIAQTVMPLKWVIVSDGSTDGTDEIVRKYAAEHPWIELLRMPERQERHFAGKVHAFNAGRANVIDLGYDVIGNLDGDTSFGEDYFDFMMRKFGQNPRLGVAGTPFKEGTFQYDYRFASTEHVSGQIQLFRRQCFEDIGGYVPNKWGGIDLVAVIKARMMGWQTQSFLEKSYEHHRKMGSAAKYSGVKGAFWDGQRDYSLGCDPLWQLTRSLYRMVARPPLVLGGSLCFAGFFWSMVTRAKILVPDDLVQFRRAEERRRLRELMKRLMFKRSLQRPSSDSQTDIRNSAGQ
jgi:glycosyltransferase involved in cell wall biosynthesis